ncbi:MAG: nucleotidyltransferase [Candidatus Paceibacterota bacterium]|jgi:tRNA nucleotidyltransferase (CCA-adding enzyme)
MTTNEYLITVLELQKLGDDSKEMKELQGHRADVEKLLRDKFKDCSPKIRYGGSKAKGTLISAMYDLDIICYFPNDDMSAGNSLEDIYNNVKSALEKEYCVIQKNSALRLKSKDAQGLASDFHIDVVPGRYVEGDDGDCFIFQANADKTRLKTNLDKHISHVRGSGVTDTIKLLKLWKVRKGLRLKQFIWELLIIDLLKGKSSKSLEDQLLHVWTVIRDTKDPISVEDPANPNGNDLSDIMAQYWQELSSAANSTLKTIENLGWESVFGTSKLIDETQRISGLTQASSAAIIKTKPWVD